MRVVASVEVTAEHPTEVFADDLLDHGPTAGVMVLIVANGWGRSCPDIAILSVFSPPRLIHLDGRAGSDLCFEHIQMRLHLFFQAMLQFNNLSIADRDGMQRTQVGLDLSNGQTHHQAQGRNQASQPDSDAPLTHNLFLQIHWGFMPFLTVGTPAFVEIMVRHPKRGGKWNLDDLSYPGKADASQTVNTNFKLVESVQLSWPTERRNFRKKDDSFGLEREMSSKRRRQREPKATGIIVQISPAKCWDLQAGTRNRSGAILSSHLVGCDASLL